MKCVPIAKGISYDACHRSPTPIPHPASCGTGRTQSNHIQYTDMEQHPTKDTLRIQVNYKPKCRDKHTRGPKRVKQNPAIKAHTLMVAPLIVDTANASL